MVKEQQKRDMQGSGYIFYLMSIKIKNKKKKLSTRWKNATENTPIRNYA